MRELSLNGWKNYPTKLWAERLQAPKWREAVIAAAKQARTLEGFRQANLEALTPDPGELHEWAEQFVDWPTLWRFFREGAQRPPRPQAKNMNRRAA